MMMVICGTSRPQAHSRTLAARAHELLKRILADGDARLLDPAELQPDLFAPKSFASPPKWFEDAVQQPILRAAGLVFVVPEYNGSYPGVLKAIIDLLRFPESFRGTPAAIIACSSGGGGGVRAAEHLASVLAYRRAHLFGEKALIPDIENALARHGESVDAALSAVLTQFAAFADRLASHSSGRHN